MKDKEKNKEENNKSSDWKDFDIDKFFKDTDAIGKIIKKTEDIPSERNATHI